MSHYKGFSKKLNKKTWKNGRPGSDSSYPALNFWRNNFLLSNKDLPQKQITKIVLIRPIQFYIFMRESNLSSQEFHVFI